MDTQVVLLLALLAALVVVGARMFMGRVSPEQAKALVKDGALLLDVRTQVEFERGHLDGATLIPLQQLEARLAEIAPKDRPVVVYCASGARSRSAKSLLEGAGFTAVHDLGAMGRWRA